MFGAAMALVFALPMLASAATISDALFSNGDTTIDAQGNSTVSGTFTLQVGVNEVCEVIRTQAAPQAFTDTQVGGTLGYQFGTYTNVPFSVKVSPNTGNYNATVQCAGIYGGNHSVDGNDGIVVGPQSLGTIRVTANTSTSVGSNEAPSWFTIWLNAFMGAQCVHDGGTWNGTACTPKPVPPAPTASPKCALIAPFLGATPYAYSSLGVQLQSALLLDNPNSIPLLAAGSTIPMGYFGVQTHAALAAYNATYHCN